MTEVYVIETMQWNFNAGNINSFMTEVLSYRNLSIDLLCKSMDWFPYDRDLHRERVNVYFQIFNESEVEYFHWFSIFEKFSFMPIKFTWNIGFRENISKIFALWFVLRHNFIEHWKLFLNPFFYLLGFALL